MLLRFPKTNRKNLMDVFLVEPEDVTNIVLHFLSDASRYITGTASPVDVGYLLKV